MKTGHPESAHDPIQSLQSSFLRILPHIQRYAQFHFRSIRCRDKRQEYLCEMLALGWKWFVRLVEQGKDPTLFVSALANFAARAVKSGRRLCGKEKSKDVLSPSAQRQFDFTIHSLSEGHALYDEEFAEALKGNPYTPPDEQAAFRLDWPSWLSTRTDRDRRLIRDLMVGEHTNAVAEKYGLTSSRISQLRREYRDDWLRFRGESILEEAL